MTDRKFHSAAVRFRSAGIAVCAAVAIALTAGGCSSGYDENVVPQFIQEVNGQTSSTGIYAGVLEDSTVYLSKRLENSPENNARIRILKADETAQKALLHSLREAMDEGLVLACLVKENRKLAFQVETDADAYYVIFTPKEIRDIAFSKND